MDRQQFFEAYVECALWTSIDSDSGFLVVECGARLDGATLAEIHTDCDEFLDSNSAPVKAAGLLTLCGRLPRSWGALHSPGLVGQQAFPVVSVGVAVATRDAQAVTV